MIYQHATPVAVALSVLLKFEEVKLQSFLTEKKEGGQNNKGKAS